MTSIGTSWSKVRPQSGERLRLRAADPYAQPTVTTVCLPTRIRGKLRLAYVRVRGRNRDRTPHRARERARVRVRFLFGFTFGFVFGFLFGLVVRPAFGLVSIRYLTLLLPTRSTTERPLPWRLDRFLHWCYQAGLVRIAGIGYQFRHRELQDYLARQPQP